MAGASKSYAPAEIVQGPGDLWVIGTAPDDAAVRLTLASDGTPDATAHPASVHLGAISSAITTVVKPKAAAIELDQFDSPIGLYATDLDAQIQAEMAQMEAAKLQRMLGVGTYSTGAGYKQTTFGGLLTVPKACIAAISATRDNAKRYWVSLLYSAVATGGFAMTWGRSKPNFYKAGFQGLADMARTAGKRVGVVYKTLTDAVGGTPTPKDFNLAEVFQGPVDLWLIDPAPTDVAQRVTLDPATLTPDLATHANAKHLGMTEAAVTFSVTPKIELVRADQSDAAIDCFISTLEAKIEADMLQTTPEKLARALGAGTYSTTPGSFEQITFGGTDIPASYCIAAIGRKRLDATKAVVGCLFNVNAADGLTLTMSRKKASTYKLSCTGLMDPNRTAGRQIGIFHEMI
jgi:hypothetical protein